MAEPDFNCWLVVFDNTHQALRGEEVLKEHAVPHETVSTPPYIQAGCGISLRIHPEALAEVEEMLAAAGVIYSRTEPHFCMWLD